MSKTESRECWASNEFLELVSENTDMNDIMNDFCDLKDHKTSYHCNKITITWQAPERVVTISESEFDKVRTMLGYDNGERDKVLNAFKEKLFKGLK